MGAGWMTIVMVVAILLIDQLIKIWVKTHMTLGEAITIAPWFQIRFIENNGMAYGMELGSKVALSLFRVVAIAVIACYVWRQVKAKARRGYIACLAMVIAGAAGNLVDCLFYGLAFDASTPFSVAEAVALGEGYAPFLMGKVVDMFYFPLIVTTWPSWVPVWGGDEFVFFSPIFNFADASISVGVALLLLFYRRELSTIEFSLGRKKGQGGEQTESREK